MLADSHVPGIADWFPQKIVIPGTHTYTVVGHTASGGTVTSNAVTLTAVPAIQSPVTATLSQPIGGATYYSGGSVNLASTASVPDGYTVAEVVFYANGQEVGYATSAPYNWVWQTPSAGTYSVFVRVIDTFGYVHDSTPITITVVEGLPDVTYYYNDIEGSPIAASDSAGTMIWTQNYYPYGERYINYDDETQNGLWFTGKPTEDSTGLSYYGARWYNPAIGRFYGTDPQGFKDSSPLSINRYAYADNNPYRFTDSSGENPVDTIFLGVDLFRFGAAVQSGESVAAVAIDVGIDALAVAIPVPFVGEALKGARAASEAEHAVQTYRAAQKVGSETAAGAVKRRFSNTDRLNAFEISKGKDGIPRCGYCETEITLDHGHPSSYEADHTIPYAKDGPSSAENLTPSCRTCNRSKGARTPEEWGGAVIERGAFVCSHIFEESAPILLVSRVDGDWQFLCGKDHPANELPHLVGVNHIFARDPTLADLRDLPIDWEAERADIGSPWIRTGPTLAT